MSLHSRTPSPIERRRAARDVARDVRAHDLRATADPAPPRLLCVAAHPDDESMAMGGTLARYAAEGIETFVLTATRGQRGRYRDNTNHPGPAALGRIREAELRAAARELGVREVRLLDYMDGELDRADPEEASERISAHIREIRPQVVITFGPEGLYGHPDHIAISQLATAAVLRAASSSPTSWGRPHRVSKLYYLAWSQRALDAFESAYKKVTSTVDGRVRGATPWRDWTITASIDARPWWRTVWSAVRCHTSQIDAFNRLEESPERVHESVWGSQEYYRAFSLVNGGRETETDLFAGLRNTGREAWVGEQTLAA